MPHMSERAQFLSANQRGAQFQENVVTLDRALLMKIGLLFIEGNIQAAPLQRKAINSSESNTEK
jgi:hypothetical protein